MKIDKAIISKIERKYFFVSGILDVNAEYFKKRIDEGVQHSKNNYQTNVSGMMTDWEFFNKDKNFQVLLLQMMDCLEELDSKLETCHLKQSWGLIEKFGDHTKKHNHDPAYFSGSIYLNDHHQKLYFPEINEEVTPKTGRFILFSSF